MLFFSFDLYVDLSWEAKLAIASDEGKTVYFESRRRVGSISTAGAVSSKPWIAADFVPICLSV